MKCIEYTKEYVQQLGFKILEESEKQLTFKYKMNAIYVWGNEGDENFIMITLPNFTDVTPENLTQVKNFCDEVNREVKQVKLYILKDMIIASAEVYFMEQDDFNYQLKTALSNLISAKVMYAKLEADE